MKKVLLLFALLATAILQGRAEMVALVANGASYNGSAVVTNAGATSGTKTLTYNLSNIVTVQLTNTSENYPGSFRIYGANSGADYTFTPAEGVTITNIVFTDSNSKLTSSNFSKTSSEGTISISNYKLTWEGSTTAPVKFHTTVQNRVPYFEISYTAETGKDLVTLAWTPEEDNIELGADYTAPTLSVSNEEALASVVFSSNNLDLATVDANGLITLVEGATGIVEITASIPATDEKYTAQKAVYTLIVNKPLDGNEFTEVLTNAANCFGNAGSTGYANKTYESKITNISYSANLAGGNNSIQLRSSSNSGIIVTANPNGLVAEKIIIEWNSETVSDRTLDIYGSNKPYTSTSELYNNGTSIASASYGTTEVTLTDDYQYIGLRSNKNAMYIDKITIVWVKKVYTAEGTINVLEPYAYQFGNANVLSFEPTLKLNGNPVTDPAILGQFDVVLNDQVLGTAADPIDHFAPAKGAENKIVLKKGGETIEVANLTWPEIDVEPAVELVEYVKADGGNVHAIYYVIPKTNTSGLHWTVETEHPTSLYWKEGRTGAACQFDNVATWTEGNEDFENLSHPDTFEANIAFPFAVKKDTSAQTVRLMADSDDYEIRAYQADAKSLADEIKAEAYQPGGENASTSGVADVAVDQEGEAEFFNLQGVRVEGELAPGLYIRRQGNTAVKVVVNAK